MNGHDLPGTRPSCSWECDSGNRFYEGRFPCALVADDGDDREVDVSLDTVNLDISTLTLEPDRNAKGLPGIVQTVD